MSASSVVQLIDCFVCSSLKSTSSADWDALRKSAAATFSSSPAASGVRDFSSQGFRDSSSSKPSSKSASASKPSSKLANSSAKEEDDDDIDLNAEDTWTPDPRSHAYDDIGADLDSGNDEDEEDDEELSFEQSKPYPELSSKAKNARNANANAMDDAEDSAGLGAAAGIGLPKLGVRRTKTVAGAVKPTGPAWTTSDSAMSSS